MIANLANLAIGFAIGFCFCSALPGIRQWLRSRRRRRSGRLAKRIPR